ncbi:MAG: hypothetical protein ABGY75_01975 [Gemmataceae bacterium]
MKAETDPITADEHLLRLVWEDRFTAKVPVISPRAFEPRIGKHPDTDGLSLFRESCLADPTDALEVIAEDKRLRYGIVRIPVSALAELVLTVIQKPRSDVPGHVVIPEMNSVALLNKANKSFFVDTQLRLAGIASENIVRHPLG